MSCIDTVFQEMMMPACRVGCRGVYILVVLYESEILNARKNHVTVTSEGVAAPIRFVVRLVGSFPMSDDDFGVSSNLAERNVRRLCKRHPSDSSDLPSNVVYYWPTVSST